MLVERVKTQAAPGAVVLMHDGGGDRTQTVAALRPMIQALKALGYGFTTPGEVDPGRRCTGRPPAGPGGHPPG